MEQMPLSLDSYQDYQAPSAFVDSIQQSSWPQENGVMPYSSYNEDPVSRPRDSNVMITQSNAPWDMPFDVVYLPQIRDKWVKWCSKSIWFNDFDKDSIGMKTLGFEQWSKTISDIEDLGPDDSSAKIVARLKSKIVRLHTVESLGNHWIQVKAHIRSVQEDRYVKSLLVRSREVSYNFYSSIFSLENTLYCIDDFVRRLFLGKGFEGLREVMIVLERLEYELRWLPFSNYELSELFHRSWGQMMESISTLQILLNGRHPQQLQVTHMVDVGSRKVFEIPGYLQKRTLTHALGDYCAKENFMHEQYAVTLGLPINRVERSSVRIGNGKEIKTNGTVQTSFRFRNESSQHMLKFHILPDCVQNVILGKSFLKMTQTFSSMANFTRRVKERIIDGLPARHDFLYLGDSAPKFTGLINGSPQEALDDSGANMLLMDEDYARHNNIYVVDDNEHRTRLRFADGSTADTSGIAYSVQWQFGPGDPGDQSYSLDFHILKNAPSPVILNDAFLFNNNAYSKYGQYLIDDEDDGIHKYDDDHNHEEGSNIDHSNSIHGRGAIKVGLQIALQPVIKETVIFFFVIAWLPNTRSQHPKTWTSIPNQEQIELNRRGEAADHISNLAVHERTAAQADEDAIQREFDQRIAALKAAESLPSALSVPQAPPGQNAQQVPSGATSINTATQVNSTQTVTPSQQSAPQAAGTPGRKKSRFSFLKFRSRNSVSS